MKKIELPSLLMEHICDHSNNRKYIFIDDFFGWTEEAKNLPGITFVEAMEGNGLKCDASGKTWIPQCCTLRRGNHLTVQLREYNRETGKTKVQDIKLDEFPLFKDFPVVILTNNESLLSFAPVCSSKLELALFLAAVEAETEKRNAAHEAGYDYMWSTTANNMVSLAKFLYRSNPGKQRSLLDDVD